MFGYKYLKDVVTLEYDQSKCNGCTMCVQVCPHEVFKMVDNIAQIIERDLCMECGACMENCPTDALKVEKGVGCAIAVINGALKGTEPDCGCSDSGCC